MPKRKRLTLRARRLAATFTLKRCESTLRDAPREVAALYDQISAGARELNRKEDEEIAMKHGIVTARASKAAPKKGSGRPSVSFAPATEGGGGTVSCSQDGPNGEYCPPSTSVHESVESAHEKMGEHMGVKSKKKK